VGIKLTAAIAVLGAAALAVAFALQVLCRTLRQASDGPFSNPSK